MEQLVSIFVLLFNLVDAPRMARLTGKCYFLSRGRENHRFFFQGVSLTGNVDSLVTDERCKHHTAPRASITCHTRNFARRVHVPQDDRGILLNTVCVFPKSHSVSSMMHRTMLDPLLSSHFSTSFPTLAQGSYTSPSLLYPSMSLSTATQEGGLCCGRLAEQSPPTKAGRRSPPPAGKGS